MFGEGHSLGESLSITPEGARAALSVLRERIKSEPSLDFLHDFKATNHELEIYLVGGMVRDAVLGLPSKDYDFLFKGISSEDLEKLLLHRGRISLESDISTGVYRFKPEGGSEIYDIALPRTETYHNGSRVPKVEIDRVAVTDDLARRDFTINSMALPIFGETTEVIDPFGGIMDIKNRVIRAVGEADRRFSDDPLRMLRAIRFACRYSCFIEEQTSLAILHNASSIEEKYRKDDKTAEKQRVSYNRISGEVAGALHANPDRFFELYDEYGFMKIVFPEVFELKGLPQPPEYHSEGDAYIHTRMVLANLPVGADLKLCLAALLHDIGKGPTYQSIEESGDRIRFSGHDKASAEMAKEVLNRLHLSSEIRDGVVWLVGNHMKALHGFDEMRPSKRAEYYSNPNFLSLVDLAEADARSSLRPDGSVDLAFLESLKLDFHTNQIRAEVARGRSLINGKVVVGLLRKHRPEINLRRNGPVVGEVIRAVNDAYLAGEIVLEGAEEYATKIIEEL